MLSQPPEVLFQNVLGVINFDLASQCVHTGWKKELLIMESSKTAVQKGTGLLLEKTIWVVLVML